MTVSLTTGSCTVLLVSPKQRLYDRETGEWEPHALGVYLNNQRGMLGLSWVEVSQIAGISISGLRRIRKGETVPNRATRKALEGAFNLDAGTLDRLFGPGGTEEPDVAAAEQRAVQAHTTGSIVVDVGLDVLRTLTAEDLADIEHQTEEYVTFLIQKKKKGTR